MKSKLYQRMKKLHNMQFFSPFRHDGSDIIALKINNNNKCLYIFIWETISEFGNKSAI